MKNVSRKFLVKKILDLKALLGIVQVFQRSGSVED